MNQGVAWPDKDGFIHVGPTLPWVPIHTAKRVCRQCGPVCGKIQCCHSRRLLFRLVLLWEQLSALALGLMESPEVVMEEVVYQDGWRRMRPSNIYKPRAWRCLNAKQAATKSLAKVIAEGGLLLLALLLHTEWNMRAQMFGKQNEEINLVL